MRRAWLCGVLACLSLWAQGGAPGRDMAKEGKIEQALERMDPSQLHPFREARIAMDKGDGTTATRLLTGVVAKVPTFDPAVRRLGNLLVEAGQREEGLVLCRKAVALHRSVENLSTLAFCLAIRREGQAPPEDDQEALRLLQECRRISPDPDEGVLMVGAQASLNLNQEGTFQDFATELRKHYPNQMQTHYFGAIQEAMLEHWVAAEREIRTAQRLGLPAEVADRFLDSGVGTRALGWRTATYLGLVVSGWVGIMGLLFAAGFVLSRLTLAQANRAEAPAGIQPGEARLRKIYSVVLNVSGLYYYLSLPVVFILVIALTGAIVIGILALGWIPIKLLVLLVIGAVMTVVAMVKSFFTRPRTEDPGRPLALEEAEGLWTLVHEVAAEVGTRPIDEIRITTGTDLAVYERGTWRDKLRNRTHRVLILGTAVLSGFKVDDFRCVLAHEYGHFSNRDTAGGEIALRVQNDMYRFYLAMLHAGQANWLNVAFHFLRFYHFVFRRISHGATRLQEILADRVAAQAYGALALEGGLRHVIRRSLEFDAIANQEIPEAIAAKRPLQNLYEATPQEPASLEDAFNQALTRPTTPDDTHPSPADRFRFVAGYRSPRKVSQPGEVWGLFRDPAGLTREMMALVEQRVAQHRKFDDFSTKALPAPEMEIRED